MDVGVDGGEPGNGDSGVGQGGVGAGGVGGLDDLAGEAQQAFGRLKGDQRDIDSEVETALSRAVKKASQRVWGRRPVVETTVLRV